MSLISYLNIYIETSLAYKGYYLWPHIYRDAWI